MTAPELLPCPFCGGIPYNDEASLHIFGTRSGHDWAVACSWCEVSGPGKNTLSEAIAAWNIRADLVEAMVAEAVKQALADAMPTDTAINDLAYRMWSIHPREIGEQGYTHVKFGGKYDNPRQAWYADQIKALIKAAAIRAGKGGDMTAPEAP